MPVYVLTPVWTPFIMHFKPNLIGRGGIVQLEDSLSFRLQGSGFKPPTHHLGIGNSRLSHCGMSSLPFVLIL